MERPICGAREGAHGLRAKDLLERQAERRAEVDGLDEVGGGELDGVAVGFTLEPVRETHVRIGQLAARQGRERDIPDEAVAEEVSRLVERSDELALGERSAR